jgi:hypothetical protein
MVRRCHLPAVTFFMPQAQLHLLVDSASGVTQQAAERAYLSGMDQIPWPCRSRLQDGRLTIDRNVTESGKFHIPFQVEGRGELMLATGTLMQRDRPYLLEIELARGKLNQVRNQLADWQGMGLTVPPAVEAALRKALAEFSVASTSPEDPARAAECARRAIALGVEAGELLAETYIEQAVAMRTRFSPQLPTLVATKLDHRLLPPAAMAHLQQTFNALNVPLVWRELETKEGEYRWPIYDKQIEWCHEQSVKVFGGPLLLLTDRGVPDWLCLWEGEFEQLLSLAADYVATVIHRYRGKVALWKCAARVNVAEVLSLQEEQKLQLAVRAIEVARQCDPTTPAIICFDQPWGEYLRHSESDLSPLHFADALVRAGLQLSGIGLEINVGYLPDGSTPRDRLDMSKMLDLWSYLGLPLHITLTVPSSEAMDPKSHSHSAPPPGASHWTPESQAAWVKRYLPLLMAKAYVHSITWNQLSDAEPHEYPHGGLFDATSVAKPTFTALASLRKKYLN